MLPLDATIQVHCNIKDTIFEQYINNTLPVYDNKKIEENKLWARAIKMDKDKFRMRILTRRFFLQSLGFFRQVNTFKNFNYCTVIFETVTSITGRGKHLESGAAKMEGKIN